MRQGGEQSRKSRSSPENLKKEKAKEMGTAPIVLAENQGQSPFSRGGEAAAHCTAGWQSQGRVDGRRVRVRPDGATDGHITSIVFCFFGLQRSSISCHLHFFNPAAAVLAVDGTGQATGAESRVQRVVRHSEIILNRNGQVISSTHTTDGTNDTERGGIGVGGDIFSKYYLLHGNSVLLVDRPAFS